MLKYLVCKSLTQNDAISVSVENQKRIKSIYSFLVLQLLICLIGATFLFYFVLENWFFSFLASFIFTFIYLSISLILYSGLRKSSYIKIIKKSFVNNTVLIGTTNIDAHKTVYDTKVNKTQLFYSLILRLFFIGIFSFFIFIGLALGFSILRYKNLDNQYRSALIQAFTFKREQIFKRNSLRIDNSIRKIVNDSILVESKLSTAINLLHKSDNQLKMNIALADSQYYSDKLYEWHSIYDTKLQNLRNSLNQLKSDYSISIFNYEKSLAFKKFPIYRITQFRQSHFLLFLLFSGCVLIIFVYPYYIRYKMVIGNSQLDIDLEHSIVNQINTEQTNTNLAINSYIEKYQIDNKYSIKEPSKSTFEHIPYDDGEQVAIKNQLDIFIKNEF